MRASKSTSRVKIWRAYGYSIATPGTSLKHDVVWNKLSDSLQSFDTSNIQFVKKYIIRLTILTQNNALSITNKYL